MLEEQQTTQNLEHFLCLAIHPKEKCVRVWKKQWKKLRNPKKENATHWNQTQVKGVGRPEPQQSQPLTSICQTMEMNNI